MGYSLRRRLLIILLSTTLAAWAVIAAASFVQARRQINDLLDAQLMQSARVLLSLVRQDLYEDYMAPGYDREDIRLNTLRAHLERHRYDTELAFQIIVEEDRFRFRSSGAPEQPLSDDSPGFSDFQRTGEHWRVFTLLDPDDRIVVRVAEHQGVREELVNSIALGLLLPLAVGLPVLGFLVWNSVSRTLSPLRRLAAQIQERNPAHLDPVAGGDTPREVQPLVDALNRLLRRLGEILERERRFTSDAAHELRTPLAALKTQAQVAQRLEDPEARQRALSQLNRGIDRATRLVEQLLNLARVDPEAGADAFESVDLAELLREVMSELGSAAVVKNVDLGLETPERLQVTGNRGALIVLVRNLLDNALRYTPPCGRVDVSLSQEAGECRLRVRDSGPGIPAAEREMVFQRFYRGENNRGPGAGSGSGLGLSIVQRIAELHRARIRLENPPDGGLLVEVGFPAAAQPEYGAGRHPQGRSTPGRATGARGS